MIEDIEKLAALSRLGTMSRAAVFLRVTQSSVSKRLAVLESRLCYAVIKRSGRNVSLTAEGKAFLSQALPLIGELRSLAASLPKTPGPQAVAVGVTDSLAIAAVLAPLFAALRQAGFAPEAHVHRSPVIYERVAAGVYQYGLCVVEPGSRPKGLVCEEVGKEELVLIGAGRAGSRLPTWFIEEPAHTNLQVAANLAARFGFEHRLESFSALAQCAKAGLCQALVPAGIARAHGFVSRQMSVPKPSIKRSIGWVCRKSRQDQGLLAAVRSCFSGR